MSDIAFYLPLVFCFDNKFAPYAAVSIYSYFFASNHPLKIYCLTSSLEDSNLNLLKNLRLEFNIDISVIDVGENYFFDWKEVNHISRAAYLRLLIVDYIPEERVIYLDCDTLGLGDLRGLYETDLQGAHIAGAIDVVGGKTSKLPFNSGNKYINSGVMLMDLKGLRQNHFLKKCQEIYRQYSELVTWVDQCIINKYLEGNKFIIPPIWNNQIYANQMKYTDWDELLKNNTTSVVHFVGGVKPWMEWCNPKIFNFWMSYAQRIKLASIETLKLTSTDHALSLANVLDLNGEYERSGEIKNQIIDSLMMALRQRES